MSISRSHSNTNKYHVFVYGTLLSGQCNHDFYLENATLIDSAYVTDYAIYDLGFYPGVVPGKGIVKGELYSISENELVNLDRLECEGILYSRKKTTVTTESKHTYNAYIYEYLGSVDGMPTIPKWFQPYTSNWKDRRNNYVWYASYGSNMLFDRFRCYIEGGKYKGGGSPACICSDPSHPLATIPIEIPYNMYFRNESSGWDSKGVSFLDATKPGHAYGVAYLITREQFEHVCCQENGGTSPKFCSPRWYNLPLRLGRIADCDVYTLTGSLIGERNTPSEAYLETLRKGLKENYPHMSVDAIEEYINSCINNI